MSKRRQTLIFCVVFALFLLGGVWWIALPRDSVFQGKPESEWIKSIQYNGDDAQTQRWRDLGPDGLHLLARTLDDGRFYRKSYRWIMPRLPGALSRLLYRRLPDPAAAHPPRMCVISLLSQLGTNARPVEAAIARALSDDDNGVRLSALGCYESGLLDVIGERAKAARLPLFLKAMNDPDWAIRNNAAVALWFYTNDAPVVSPVLIGALSDKDIHVRMRAARTLAHIDKAGAVKAGVVPVLIQILKDPDDQIAFQAAEDLGDLGKDASPAVAALVESVRATNHLVSDTAARALKRIDAAATAKAKQNQ